MKKKCNIKLNFLGLMVGLLLLLSGGWCDPLGAQPLPRDDYFNNAVEQHSFNTEEWNALTKDLNYEEDGAKKEDSKHRKANTRGTGEGDEDFATASPGKMSPFWAAVFKFLVIGLAVVVLAVLLYHIIGSGSLFYPKGKKIKSAPKNVSIETIEANIHESDLDRYIREAVTQGQYPLAIRLYYLAVIKELSIRKWIKWKREKTNRDYLREMSASPLLVAYREVTRIFERIWYGNADLQESDFQQLQPKFISLLEEIRNGTPTASTA